MKINLIAPARSPEWPESFWDLRTLCGLAGARANIAPLALPTLAAVTPSDVEVVLTDENVEPIDFDEAVDLVGITGMACAIPRAYEIVAQYRERGVATVMGGIHVSMLPDEAARHCDAVVVGEAEEVWEQVVRDAQKGSLKNVYQAPRFPDLSKSPIPRWDLLKNQHYLTFSIQTGRGCPHHCDFCSVSVLNGRTYRHRKIEDVLAEVETLRRIDKNKHLLIADDNLLAVPKYAEALLRSLAPLHLEGWWCQSSVDKLENDKLLGLLFDAGCRAIFIGFESISQRSLRSMNKERVNSVAKYRQIIEKIHAHGMAVLGSFILGNDTDNRDIFADTVEFILETNIYLAMINILTPLPGTKLYQGLDGDRRLLHRSWELYTGDSVCFVPSLFTEKELLDGRDYVLRRIYDYDCLVSRLQASWNRNLQFGGDEYGRIYNREKVGLLFRSLFPPDPRRLRFLLRSLWNRRKPSISGVALALNCHDFAYGAK